jgi:hypothetical protein
LSTRRAFLAAAVGSASDDGLAIHVGDALDVTQPTSLTNQTNNADLLRLTSQGSGTALSAKRDEGTALFVKSTNSISARCETNTGLALYAHANQGQAIRAQANGAGEGYLVGAFWVSVSPAGRKMEMDPEVDQRASTVGHPPQASGWLATAEVGRPCPTQCLGRFELRRASMATRRGARLRLASMG